MRSPTLSCRTPNAARLPSDRAMPFVALAAAAIVAAALIAACLAWQALTGGASPRGEELVGAALAPARDALVVDSLRRDGSAMRAGVRVGDVVEAVNGRRIANVATADRALAARAVDLRIRRGDRTLTLHLPPA